MIKLLHSRRAFALLASVIALVAISSVSALASSTKHVRVGDFWLRPGKLTIGKGTQVSWSWTGYRVHNVTVKSGPTHFRASRTQARGTFSHRFNRRGTYHLYCSIHPWMKETIVVK
jgi:plastocyanin